MMEADDFRTCLKAVKAGHLNLSPEDAEDFWSTLVEATAADLLIDEIDIIDANSVRVDA
jgi:hypothetical protein